MQQHRNVQSVCVAIAVAMGVQEHFFFMQPQPVDDVEANILNTSVRDNDQPLVYCKLPDDIAERHTLLMDPILSSGYTVVRAIETLLVRCETPQSLPRSCFEMGWPMLVFPCEMLHMHGLSIKSY
jgi:hypothetical protein